MNSVSYLIEMKVKICFCCKISEDKNRLIKNIQVNIQDIPNLQCKEEESHLLIEGCIRTDVGQDNKVNGNIVCIPWRDCKSFLTMKKLKESSTTVMVQVDIPKNHFITLHCNFSDKKVILMDSFQCIDELNMYPQLELNLKPIMKDLVISIIPVPIQKEIDGGFFQAFLNSLTVEWAKNLTINQSFEFFLKEVDTFQGILMTNRKDWVDQNTDKIYNWKTIVKKLIKVGYAKGETLDEIKSSENTKYQNLPREGVVYFELQYAKQVAYNFLSSLQEIFKTQDSSFFDRRSIVYHISEIKDIKEPFTTVKNYEQLQKYAEFLDSKTRLKFFRSFRNLCLFNSIPLKDIEIKERMWYDALLKHISDPASLMSSQLQDSLQNAKENLRNTDNDNSVFSFRNFSTIFITENGMDIIRFDGTFVDLDAVNTEINVKHDLFEKCSQIEIQAKLCFYVNCNVQWPGKNVIILTDTLVVDDRHKNYSLDVSGRDGLSHRKKNAKNGNELDNSDGLAGEPGMHGESGGNFQIIADVYRNEANMSVISNGGNGACGQNGGRGVDGISGVNGKGISMKEFNRRFPDVAYMCASEYGGNFRAFLANNTFTSISEVIATGDFAIGGRRITHGVTHTKRSVRGGEYHCKGETDDKYEVEYGCYSGYVNRESYCICFGKEGTPGTQGGNGGKAGAAGKGGFEGEINIRNWKGDTIRTITTTCRSGDSGTDGKDGKGGKGGKNGKRGNDRAHVCPSFLYNTIESMGYLKIVSSETSKSDNAYCPKREKYISVNKIAPAYPTLERCKNGENGQNTNRVNNLMTESSRTKKAPIVFETLIKERSMLFFNGKNNNQLFDNINEATSTMKEVFISKYSSTHHGKVLKESRQRKENGMQLNQILPIAVTRNSSHFNFTPMFQFTDGGLLNKFIMQRYETVLKAVKGEYKQPFPEKTLSTIFAIFSQISIQNSFDEKHYKCFLELLCLIKKKCKKPNCTTNMTNLDINYWYDSIMINFKFWLLGEANGIIKHYIHEKEKETDINDPFSKTIINDLRIGLKITFENLIVDVLDSDNVAHLETTVQNLQPKLDDLMQEIKEFRRSVFLFGRNVPMCVFQVLKGLMINTINESDSEGEMKMETHIVSNTNKVQVFKPDADFVCETDNADKSQDMIALLTWALSKTTNKVEMSCIINKLSYIDSDHASPIIKCLKYRLINQCCQISEEFLFWFLVKLLENEECINDGKYLQIVATTKPENWIFEWIIQEIVCRSDFPNESNYRKLLKEIDQNIHLFLCRYLSKLKDGELMTKHTIEVMMGTLQTLNPDVNESFLIMLGETNVFEWKYRIKWMENIKALGLFSWKDQSTLLEAAHYCSQIINRNGQILIDEINCVVRKYKIDKRTFLSALKMIYAGRLCIDIQELRMVQSSNEARRMLDYHFNYHDMSTREHILSLMKVNNNCSLPEDKLEKIKTLLHEINTKGSNPSKLLSNTGKEDTIRKDYTTKDISSFTEDDIKQWSKVCVQELKSHAEQFNILFTEIVAIIVKGIQLKRGFELRNTQQISIIAFVVDLDESHKGLLQQMSTGEGKTMVIVALSILKALKGEKVDIITSSPVLAKRDSNYNKDIFDLFRISVSNNCSENKHDRQEAYSSMVVYGEIGLFQRDILLTEFYDENIIGGRHQKNVIVDEVDSMLLDRGDTVLYLSHEIAGIDAIELVYIYIWSLVNIQGITGTDEDRRHVRICMLDALYGVIFMDNIRECCPTTIKMNVNEIWKILQEEKLIDKEGRLLTRSYVRFDELYEFDEKKSSMYSRCTMGYITNLLKDTVRKGILVEVPKFLEHFIDRHLDIWIINAFRAKSLEEGKQFIIDIERTENGRGKDANIIIMDIDTGTEQYHTQWNSGLHQFLQLKYKCAISTESLKAIFMSNISFFRLYENLYGLTGTLGTQKERNLLKDMYNVSYITIPTFQEPRFVEYETTLCESTDIWMKSITETAVLLSNSRPILVICETIHACNEIEKEFKRKGVFVHVYKNSYCELSILMNKTELVTGCIILATNLAGRGTDIRISEQISMVGGLHVILTYLPSNLRVEEQAFGRAARKGQHGSGQLIICECLLGQHKGEEKFSIAGMKIQRDTIENERISKLQQRYETFILSEEKLFTKFQQFHYQLKLKLMSKNTDAEFQKIILQALVDRWAFWLDSVESSLETFENFSSITDNLTEFFKEVDVSEVFDDNTKILEMLRSPSQLVKAGKAKTSTKDFIEAQAFFDYVIDNDKSFSESALYYKVHCLLKSGDWTADDYRIVRSSLVYCKCLIQQRIETIRNSVQIVNVVSSQYTKERETFTLSEGFVQQKENITEIYNQFIDSIDSIMGCAIEPYMFVDATCSHLNAHMIFSDLARVNILSSQKVFVFPPEEKAWQSVKDIYELYSTEIYLQLKHMKNWDRVTADHLKNILPSREELWELLIDHNVLKDRHDYILLHEGEFQMCCNLIPVHITDIIQSLKGSSLVGDIKKYIFLYPDQRNKIIAGKARPIPRCLFKQRLGFGKIFEVLQKENIVSYCSLAIVASDAMTKLETKLDKFDNVKQNSFVAIGVCDGTSTVIFDQLVKNEYISNTGRLLTDQVGNIWLSSYSQYTTEIRNIVAKHSKYRICANYLLKEHELPISIFSNPHENLFRDLIECGIVTPFKVKTNMSDNEITQKLKLLHDFESDNLCKENYLKKIEQKPIDKVIRGKYDSNEFFYRTVEKKIDKLKTEQNVSDYDNEIKCFISSRIQIYKNASDIIAQLDKTREGLTNFENCDTELESLVGRFTEKQIIVLCDEILSITYNGFGELIVLQERKWTFESVSKMMCILAIGLIQICIAIAIEFCSTGTGTLVANAFLSEGIGDIVFAVECMITGHCSMMSYLQHKKLSLQMTALSTGFGAFFARGSQFSRFGHQIGGQFLQTQSGKSLLKQGMSKRLLAKAATKWIGNKLVEVTSIKLVDAGVDFAIEKSMRATLVNLCGEITNVGPHVGPDNVEALQTTLSFLARKMNKNCAEQLIKKSMEKCFIFPKSDISMVLLKVSEIANTLCDGLGLAIEKMQYIGNSRVKCLKTITDIGNVIAKGINVAKAVKEIVQFRNLMLNKFNTEINAKLQDLQDLEIDIEAEEYQTWVNIQVDNVIKKSNTEVSKYVEKQLEEILVKPLLQTVGFKVTKQISKRARTLYRFGKRCLHYSTFKTLKEEFHPQLQQASSDTKDEIKLQYNKQLIKLLRKTKNPNLFAKIVEEGIPLGIHSVQAVAEILQAGIIIETIGGDAITMPHTFKPFSADGKNLKYVELQFHVNPETCIGHFVSKSNKKKGKYNQYDCLLTAVMQETGLKLERKCLADKIRNTTGIRRSIEQGIHEHYIIKGGIGGVARIKKNPLTADEIVKRCRSIEKHKQAKKNKEKELNDLNQSEEGYQKQKGIKEKEKNDIVKKIKKTRASLNKALRDQSKKSNKFNKATGNDEFYETHLVETWSKMSIRGQSEYVEQTRIYFANQSSELVDYIKLFYTIRVDTIYCLHMKYDALSNQNQLQGHPGALFQSKKLAGSNSGGLTIGSKEIHTERTKEVRKYNNHLLSILYGLKKHIEDLPTKETIQKLDQKNCYSALCLDLENKDDKKKLIRGLELEIYKLCIAAEFLIKNNKACMKESKGKRVGELKENNIEESKETNIEVLKTETIESSKETNINAAKIEPIENLKETNIEVSKTEPSTFSIEDHLQYLEKVFSKLKPTTDPEDEYIKSMQDKLNMVDSFSAFGNILKQPALIDKKQF